MSGKIVGKVLGKTDEKLLQFVSISYFPDKFIKIEMKHISEGLYLIGQIVSIEPSNPYFDKAISIRYVEEKDESVTNQSLYISKVKPLVFIQNGTITDIDFPPAPGSNVLTINEDELRIAIGLEQTGIEIGVLKGFSETRIIISLEKLFRTHFSILGRTGSGKSYFTKQFLNRISNDTQFLIFSPTDEYDELNLSINCKLYKYQDITLPFDSNYFSILYGLTFREQGIFENFYKSFSENNSVITSQEILKKFREWLLRKEYSKYEDSLFPQLKDESIQKELPQYTDALLSKIRQKNLNFSKTPFKVPFDTSAVLNISDFSTETQDIIIAYVLNNVINIYKKTKRKRLVIVIEEAHNFAPSVQNTASKDKIIQIAREGRKLGLNICLISQRPRFIDQTVLSQAGTLFLFNIPHPEDIQHVLGTSSMYSSDMPDIVRKLQVGECLIIGDAVKYPAVCKVASDK